MVVEQSSPSTIKKKHKDLDDDSEAEQASLDQLFGYTGILSEAAPHIITLHLHTGPAKKCNANLM